MATKNNPGAYDCYAKAEPDEPMFVLLGRDPAAMWVVTIWIEIRKRMGSDRAQIEEATKCAIAMGEYAEARKSKEALGVADKAFVDTLVGMTKDLQGLALMKKFVHLIESAAAKDL